MAKRRLSLKRRSHQLVENEEDKKNKYPENSKMAKQSVVDRFNTTSDEEMVQICSAFITPNTEKNTRWSQSGDMPG